MVLRYVCVSGGRLVVLRYVCVCLRAHLWYSGMFVCVWGQTCGTEVCMCVFGGQTCGTEVGMGVFKGRLVVLRFVCFLFFFFIYFT